jgi:hypothetical protein
VPAGKRTPDRGNEPVYAQAAHVLAEWDGAAEGMERLIAALELAHAGAKALLRVTTASAGANAGVEFDEGPDAVSSSSGGFSARSTLDSHPAVP